MSKGKIFMMCLMVMALLAMPMLACGDGGTEYELTISADPEGGGTTDPAVGVKEYDEGTVVDITATAAEGYEFDSWSGDVADAHSASTTVTVDADKTVTANFNETTCDLTMAVHPEGSGTTTPAVGVHTYDEGTVVDITATPAEGWAFDKWLGLYVTDKSSSSTTVPLNSDMTVTATFVEITYHTLTMAVAGNGSTDPAVGTHDYAEGTEVTITATPEDGSYFINWDGDVADPLSDSTTVNMATAKTVTANFGLLGGPDVIIDAPTGGEEVKGTVAIQATVTDDLSQIISGEYRIDDGEYAEMIADVTLPANTVTFTADWDSTADDGYHIIYIRATNDSEKSTTETVSVSVRNLVAESWTYEVTFVLEALEPILGSDTEVTTWEMTVAGVEPLTTDYFSGDCLRLDIDYGDLGPNDPETGNPTEGNCPLRFKQTLKTWLVSSSIWTDVDTGQMMRQNAEVLMPGGSFVNVMVTNEWVAEDTYISHTVLSGLSVDVPDEFHKIEPAATPVQVVTTPAGEFICDVTEDHLLSDQGRALKNWSLGAGDGSTKVFGPPPTTTIDEYSEIVYVDGERKVRDTDYTIDYEAGTVTFTTAPALDKEVTISYNWLWVSGDTMWKINYVDHITPGYGLIKQIDYMYGGNSTDPYGSTQVLVSVSGPSA